MQLSKFTIPFCNGKGLELARKFNDICTTDNFYRSLERERDRSDRFGLKFAVVSFDLKTVNLNGKYPKLFTKAVHSRIRVSDEIGWIDDQNIGLLLFNTEKEGAIRFVKDVKATIDNNTTLPNYRLYVYPADGKRIQKNFRNIVLPKNENRRHYNKNVKKRLHPNLIHSDILDSTSRSSHPDEKTDLCQNLGNIFPRKMPLWKRFLDITGASIALVVFSPFFLIIPVFIKVLAPGPVFFKQERVGFGGRKFMFLKFRSMKVNADPTVHRQYLAGLINSEGEVEKPMIKLDGRNSQIIPFFKFIRKTYLDELPQLINVLRGEMSLIGPRPPIPYEVAEYSRWHNSRFDIVPGMTGLWQISGKNRLTFKEMVRLDINYCRKLSFVSDLKILFKTPLVILSEFFFPEKKLLSKREG